MGAKLEKMNYWWFPFPWKEDNCFFTFSPSADPEIFSLIPTCFDLPGSLKFDAPLPTEPPSTYITLSLV